MKIQGHEVEISEHAASDWFWVLCDNKGRVLEEGVDFKTEAAAEQDAHKYIIEKIDREEQELADMLEAEIYGTCEDQARAFYNQTRL